jgi:hypothetical protein
MSGHAVFTVGRIFSGELGISLPILIPSTTARSLIILSSTLYRLVTDSGFKEHVLCKCAFYFIS